jgi:hypothetical protein
MKIIILKFDINLPFKFCKRTNLLMPPSVACFRTPNLRDLWSGWPALCSTPQTSSPLDDPASSAWPALKAPAWKDTKSEKMLVISFYIGSWIIWSLIIQFIWSSWQSPRSLVSNEQAVNTSIVIQSIWLYVTMSKFNTISFHLLPILKFLKQKWFLIYSCLNLWEH